MYQSIVIWKRDSKPQLEPVYAFGEAKQNAGPSKPTRARCKGEIFLCNPEPDTLEEIARDLHRPVVICRVKSSFAGEKIDFGSRDPSCSLNDLPADEEDEKDENPDVGRGEISNVERREYVEAVEEDDQNKESQRSPGKIRLEGRLENQGVAVDALCPESIVEFDIGNAYAYPREEISNGCQPLEPRKDSYSSSSATTEIGKERNSSGDEHAEVGHALL